VWLEDHQRAVQGVARFFKRNCERGFGDQPGHHARGDLHKSVRESRERGEIILGHSHELVGLAVGDDLHPVVLELLQADLALGKKADKLEKFLRRDRRRAILLDLGLAGGADGELEVGGGDGEAAALRFAEKVRENGDGGLALDDALGQRKLVEKLVPLYAEFHFRPSLLFAPRSGGYFTSFDYNK